MRSRALNIFLTGALAFGSLTTLPRCSKSDGGVVDTQQQQSVATILAGLDTPYSVNHFLVEQDFPGTNNMMYVNTGQWESAGFENGANTFERRSLIAFTDHPPSTPQFLTYINNTDLEPTEAWYLRDRVELRCSDGVGSLVLHAAQGLRTSGEYSTHNFAENGMVQGVYNILGRSYSTPSITTLAMPLPNCPE